MTRNEAATPGNMGLGARVREHRLREGLSARALAERAGLSHVTVSAVERGREPSAGTLRAIVDAIPGLRNEPLIGRDAAGMPATGGEWRAVASLVGFEARLARLDVTVRSDGRLVSELAIEGLRPTRGSLAERDRRLAVLGAPLAGPALALALQVDAHASPAGRRHVLRLGDVEHSLWLPRALDGGEARYRRRDLRPVAPEAALPEHSPHGRPFVLGACAWIDHPVRRLSMSVRFPEGRGPERVRVLAWPATLATAPGEDADTWPAMYPHAPRCLAPRGGVARLSVEQPPPGTCLALCWDEALAARGPATSPVRVRPVVRRPVAEVLRDARRAAGLTRRALARSMRVSPASVVETERGRDPRLGFLRRALEALPDLHVAELLAPGRGERAPSLDELRDRQVHRFGLRADREECDVRIAANGDAAIELRRSGLTVLGAPQRRIRVRLGPTRGPQTARGWEVEDVDADGGSVDPTVRVVSRDRGPTVHELRFLAGSSGRPLTHVRRMTVRGQVAMSRDAPGATFDERGRRAEAIYMEPSLPSDALRLTVRLPRGYWPDDIVAAVVPRACGPTWHPEDLAPSAHPGGVRLECDRAGRRIVLEVERPLVGLRYEILWFLG